MYCEHCGKEIDNDSKFCEFCGGQVADLNEKGRSSVKTVSSDATAKTAPAAAKKPLGAWKVILIVLGTIVGLAVALFILLLLIPAEDTPDTKSATTLSESSDTQASIDALASLEQDLDLMRDFIAYHNEENDETIEESLARIVDYRSQFNVKISTLKASTPASTDALRVQNSVIDLYKNGEEMLAEFEDVILYAMDVSSAFDLLDAKVTNASNAPAVDSLLAISDGFTACIEELNIIEPPSFMQYRHHTLLDNLAGFEWIVYDMAYAVDINDPLRLSSCQYFLDYYVRLIDMYAVNLDDDMNNRLEKYDSDIAFLTEWTDDLEYFINTAVGSKTIDLSLLDKQYLMSENDPVVSFTINAPDEIIPANYRSMEYLTFIQLWTDHDSAEVMVTVEIPEYTHQYKEKISVSRAETELAILPPLLTDIAAKLNSSQDAQINITIENLDTGELVSQQSIPITLYSIYDMRWGSPEGYPYYENVLAWVTPEADAVLTLLRYAADSANYISDGYMNNIVGYQGDPNNAFDITTTQTAAIMHAMAETMQVKYINAAFSTTDWGLQRIATPERVLNNASGLCIETAATLASAIQATGMNAMLLILPGHAQVAVELWDGTGEYILVETTALDSFRDLDFGAAIAYFTQDEWQTYIDQESIVAIDCSMAKLLDIHPIN